MLEGISLLPLDEDASLCSPFESDVAYALETIPVVARDKNENKYNNDTEITDNENKNVDQV